LIHFELVFTTKLVLTYVVVIDILFTLCQNFFMNLETKLLAITNITNLGSTTVMYRSRTLDYVQSSNHQSTRTDFEKFTKKKSQKHRLAFLSFSLSQCCFHIAKTLKFDIQAPQLRIIDFHIDPLVDFLKNIEQKQKYINYISRK